MKTDEIKNIDHRAQYNRTICWKITKMNEPLDTN